MKGNGFGGDLSDETGPIGLVVVSHLRHVHLEHALFGGEAKWFVSVPQPSFACSPRISAAIP